MVVQKNAKFDNPEIKKAYENVKEKTGISRKDICNFLGVSEGSFARILNGQTNVGTSYKKIILERLRELAELKGVMI